MNTRASTLRGTVVAPSAGVAMRLGSRGRHIFARAAPGTSATIIDVHCERPGDIQPGDEAFDEGARFALFEEEVVVSEDELVRLVRLASEAQKRALPDQAAAIDEVLTGWA